MANPIATLTFENVRHTWLWLALIAAGAWMLWFTYRGIFERSERRLTWVLLALRAAGLAALVLALAKPTWTRESEIVDPGHVGVVLDDSISMSLRDPSGRTRFARARELVERLRPAVESGAGTGGSRAEMVLDVFDINGRPISAGQLPDEPRAGRTDLAKAVGDAVRQLRSKALAGIVLVTDGVDNAGQSAGAAASSRSAVRSSSGPAGSGLFGLDQLGVPIYTVGFDPDPSAGRYDLAVRTVSAPERVMVNNDVNVEVLVSKTGIAQAQSQVPVEVELSIKRGREVIASKKLTLPAGDAEEPVSIPIKPTEPGSFVFTAAVAGDADERLLANNSQHFALRVDAEPIRVFYIEGFLRWEFTYLRRQLEADPDVSVVTAVRRPNPDVADPAPPGDLLTADRLDNLDVVILGDMEASYFTAAEYAALTKWIDAGKSLLVLGGYRSFGSEGWHSSPLADALPVVFADATASDPTQLEEPFVPELSDAGRSHPIFRITGDRAADAALWAALPPLAGCSVVSSEKPGAVTLMTGPPSGAKPLVLLATHRYGQGHVAVLTADTTWRWTRLPRIAGQSDTLYARFWGQMIRWLAGRETKDERPVLAVSTDRPDYDAGKKVTIRAVRQPRPGQPAGAGTVSVEVADESGKSVGVQMASSSAEPDLFTGSFYPTAGGRYQIAASLAEAGQPAANQAAEFLVHGAGLELADTGTRKELLRDLAAKTGGLYFDIDQADKLAEKLERRERRIPRVIRSEFWDSPALFLAFLAAITAEWLIRRRNHLV